MWCRSVWLGLKTAVNPSAVTLTQWMWLETCCWCSKDQDMTFGKPQQWWVFLWSTDRRPCQQSLRTASCPKQKLDKNVVYSYVTLIMLSRHGFIYPVRACTGSPSGIVFQWCDWLPWKRDNELMALLLFEQTEVQNCRQTDSLVAQFFIFGAVEYLDLTPATDEQVKRPFLMSEWRSLNLNIFE